MYIFSHIIYLILLHSEHLFIVLEVKLHWFNFQYIKKSLFQIDFIELHGDDGQYEFMRIIRKYLKILIVHVNIK